jgi:hypothetical protein
LLNEDFDRLYELQCWPEILVRVRCSARNLSSPNLLRAIGLAYSFQLRRLHRSLWSVSEDHEELTDQVIDEWVARMRDHDLQRIDLKVPREFASAIEDSILILEEVQGLYRFHPIRRMPISSCARFLVFHETRRNTHPVGPSEDVYKSLPEGSRSQKLACLYLAGRERDYILFESLWEQFRPEMENSPTFWQFGATAAFRRRKFSTAHTRASKSVQLFRQAHVNYLTLGRASFLCGKWRTLYWAAGEVVLKKERIERRVSNYANFR